MTEQEMSHLNQKSWNSGAYQAWVNRFGTADEAAHKLMRNPAARIGKSLEYMGDVQGKRIANLLGSNGTKAVALALLGAKVTVVDFSSENARYALELADASKVQIEYIVSDVLQLPAALLSGEFDAVYLEQGVLHYFVDLDALFQVVQGLLKPGGKLILQDFHPVSTKLIVSRGTTAGIRKHKVAGNYFDTSIVDHPISFSKYAGGQQTGSVQTVKLRKWTLGEIVTSIARHNMYIRILDELPNQSSDVFDPGIPKTFTIAAEKLILT